MHLCWGGVDMSLGVSHRVCELTQDGMAMARRYLEGIRASGWTPLPTGLLGNPAYSQPVEPEVFVEERAFANRREAGEYLLGQLEPLGAAQITERPYLWSWLGMLYLEHTMTGGESGGRRFAEIAYLIDPHRHDSRDRSHHRLLMAYDIWRLHGDEAWMLLYDRVDTMGQFALRVVQSPGLFRSLGVMRLIHQLYGNRTTGNPLPGTLGSDNASAPAGSLPRLIVVLNQLSLTYDVYDMTSEQLLSLLPPEFDSFRQFTSPATP